jgi:hypothetical protein
MTNTHSPARTAIDAIVARDKLVLSTEDYERLVSLYDETQRLLSMLRLPEVHDSEPAVIYHASR